MIDGYWLCFGLKRRLLFTTPLLRLPADVVSAAAGVTRPDLNRTVGNFVFFSFFLGRRRRLGGILRGWQQLVNSSVAVATNVWRNPKLHTRRSHASFDKRRHERLCLPLRPSEAEGFVFSPVCEGLRPSHSSQRQSVLSETAWANKERIVPPGPAAGVEPKQSHIFTDKLWRGGSYVTGIQVSCVTNGFITPPHGQYDLV